MHSRIAGQGPAMQLIRLNLNGVQPVKLVFADAHIHGDILGGVEYGDILRCVGACYFASSTRT